MKTSGLEVSSWMSTGATNYHGAPPYVLAGTSPRLACTLPQRATGGQGTGATLRGTNPLE